MMDEYIKRGDAIKAIAYEGTGEPRDIIPLTLYTAQKKIMAIPAADVVEVVRCKDCKHWGGVTYGFVCRKFSGIDTKICMGADRYCSYGERKE